MQTQHKLRALVTLILAVSLLAAACTSSTDPAATTTTSSGASSTTAPASDDERVAAMCRTLDLFSNAGVTAGFASESITATDLVKLRTPEQADYGNLLVAAPRQSCARHITFADDIAYWLGF